MRFNDLKDNKIISEEPVGMIQRGVDKVLSKVPGSTGIMAKGRMSTATVANDLYAKYYDYIGRSGQQPTIESIRKFLKSMHVDPAIINAHAPLPTPESQLAEKMRQELSSFKKTTEAVPVGTRSIGGQPVDPAMAQQQMMVQKQQQGIKQVAPEQAAPVAKTPVPKARPFITARKGQTLYQIAIDANKTVDQILQLNPQIKDKDNLVPGQKILVRG